MKRHQQRPQQKLAGKPSSSPHFRYLTPASARAFEAATALMKSGLWQQAESAYRRVLVNHPSHSPTLHHLGLIAFKLGQAGVAIDVLRRAIEIDPNYSEARLNLADISKMQGKCAEALVECRKVVDAEPKNAAARAELGNILKDLGDNIGAIDAYRGALELSPVLRVVETNLAQCLVEAGEAAAGIEMCLKVLARDPAHSFARRLLIRAFSAAGRLGEAISAIECDGAENERAGLLVDVAAGLNRTGKIAEAIAFLHRSIERHPDAVDLHLMMGSLLKDAGRLDEAFGTLKRGLDLDASRADGYVTLGFVLGGQGAFKGAIAALRHATELKPDWALAHCALGSVLQMAGRLEEARQALADALERDSRAVHVRVALCNVRRQLCEWEGLEQEEKVCLSQLRSSDVAVTPFHLLGFVDRNEDMLECGQRYSRQIVQKVPPSAVFHAYNPCVMANNRIRIGYLSSDFGNHATSMLLTEVLERHDRGRFEVIGYCHSPDDGSALRQRVISAFDRFESIEALGHCEAAQKIHSDGVELLIDLKGYTKDARQEILVQRPAPVQVNFLGYPATSGADYIDYILADSIVAPIEHQIHYSERIVHLDACYQPNDSLRRIDRTPVKRSDFGLPDDGFVFCSFNNNFKINRPFFESWMSLLEQVPGSVLWLLQKTPQMRSNLEREASRNGIDPRRLVFAEQLPSDRHLARHALADLFLDSLPCSAHTTASDALWAGLPLLTCMGSTFAGRVAASVLSACNMPDLIATSLEEYSKKALQLARSSNQLDEFKAKLRANREMAPLYDTARYVRSLESAFKQMSELNRKGQRPRSFTVREFESQP